MWDYCARIEQLILRTSGNRFLNASRAPCAVLDPRTVPVRTVDNLPTRHARPWFPRRSPGDDWGAFDEDDWRGKSRAGAAAVGSGSDGGGGGGGEGASPRPRGDPGMGEDVVPGLLGGARFGTLLDGAAEEQRVSDDARDEAARSAGR